MITSVHNPRVQAISKLQKQAKVRREKQAFVIEGVRLAQEALQGGGEAQLLLFTDQLDKPGMDLVSDFSARGVQVEQVTETVMNAISETETPQGIMVVLSLLKLPIPEDPDFVLVLDGIRDPGNLGTILRTAMAAGVQAVLLAPGSVDAFAHKVVRAGMGAHFRLPVHQPGWDGINQVLRAPGSMMRIYLADSTAGISYSQVDLRSPVAIIVGGEASGAGSESAALADELVHIPMPGGSESLNAAVAAGILIFEVVRQRVN
jgi:TrmH family RNA methyltransferase